jgi:hypothetical protein
VDVGRGLDVDRDVVRPRLDEVGDVPFGPFDHEVHVEHGLGRQRLAQRGDDHRPEGDRRDEVAVHHVAVDQPRACGHDLLDLRSEPGEVGGEDARGDACEPFAHTGHSIDPPQCTHVMFAVSDMRTIVECSPQSGHTERSS